MEVDQHDCPSEQTQDGTSSIEPPLRTAACSLVKSMETLSKQQPDMLSHIPCKALHDLIVKWTVKEPDMEIDVSKFYEYILAILQDSRYKTTEVNRQLLVFALRCAWKILPHLDNPGKVVLSMLQRCVLGVGASVGSHQVDKEVLNIIFTLWPKWGVQAWEDGMLENLGKVLCLALQSEPYPNLHNAGKLVQGVVKTIFLRLERKDLARLESTGVHKCFRQLLLHYEAFTWQQFQAVVLGCGLMEDIVNRSSDYLQEGVLEMLLFAAKEFANGDKSGSVCEGGSEADKKGKVQWDIWTLLSLLCRQNRDISSSLYISGALDVVMSVLSSPAVERAPIYQFVASLMSGNPDIKTNILEGTSVLADVNSTLLEGSKSPFIDHNAIKAGDIFTSLMDKMTPQTSRCIVQQQLLQPLMLGAKQHPQFLAECALRCVRDLTVVGSTRQDGSTRENPGSAIDLDEVEKELAQCTSADTIYSATYKDGYHTFLQNLLESEALSDPNLVSLLYKTIATFSFHCPLKVSHVILTEEFLSSVVQATKRHLSQFQDVSVTSAVASAVSSLTFNCLNHPKSTLRLQGAGMHELVVHCLVNLPHELTLLKWLMVFSNLVYCYRFHLKDLKCMFECGAHKVLVSTALQYGMNSAIGDELDRCLLNWTYDKESSDRFGKENFTVTLMPLLEHRYSASLRRAVIHAIGNIAISGQKAKLALLERGIHIILLEHIRDRRTNTEAPSYLSACCRLLHIISSSDSAKMLLLEQNCINTMMELAQSYPGVVELEWRPLGAISAICFLPVSCRHHIYNHELLHFLSLLLKSSNQPRVLGYAALVLIALAEDDEGLLQVARLDIDEKLRYAINNPNYVAIFGDLKRWGSIILEKMQLYAIKLPQSLFRSLDIPPLPSLRSGCTSALSDCHGRATTNSEKYSSFVPEAPKMSKTHSDQLLALGRNPYEIFRVGRLFGSTNGLCSNCDKDDSSSELVLRPHSLSPAHYQELITMGWYRRGGVKLFRFHDVHSIECCDWETRVIVKDFSQKSHKSFVKTVRRMPKELEVRRRPAYFNPEAFELYNTYHVERYDKPPKSEHSYVEHVVNSPVKHTDGQHITLGTFHDEYRLNGKLVAVSVLDVVPKGMVSIYMWYDLSREISKYSFGVYSALREIESVQERQKADPHVEFYYLQGWNEHNRRLKYKGDYEPEEFYAPCITDYWISSKEGVREEKRRAVEQSEPQQQTTDNGVLNDLSVSAPMDTSNSSGQKPKEKKSPFRSINNDRVAYRREFGVPCVDDLIICLNHQMYITFGELKDKFPLSAVQKELMEKRFEEYMLAVGGTLSSQMVVDLLVVPL